MERQKPDAATLLRQLRDWLKTSLVSLESKRRLANPYPDHNAYLALLQEANSQEKVYAEVLGVIGELESGSASYQDDPMGADKLPQFWETSELEEI